MENEELILEEEVAEITEENCASEEVEVETAEPSPLEKALAEADAMKLLAQRTQADFDNYRKRNADLVARARQDGKADAVLEILPIVDNFDRAIPLIQDESVKEGVEKIAKQFGAALTKLGVSEIDAEGQPFNPDLMNAVFTEEVDGVEPDTVTGVLQKGYMLDGKVVRYAMVKVSK